MSWAIDANLAQLLSKLRQIREDLGPLEYRGECIIGGIAILMDKLALLGVLVNGLQST
jgi:hypothetical protein